MAILKDLIVTGVSRFLGKIYAPDGVVGKLEGKADSAATAESVLFAKGTGTAAKTSTPYNHAKWDAAIDGITELTDGMTIAYQIPVAGHGTYGTCLQINDLGYHPVVRAVNSMISTRYAVDSTILLTYNSNITGTVYADSATSSAIQGCWVCINDMDNNDTATAYNVYDYYLRPKANQAIYRYKICALDIDNRVVPLVTTNQSNTTLVAKQTTQVPFRGSAGLFYYASSTTVAAGGTVGGQLLRRMHSFTGAQYTFNGTVGTTTCLSTYKVVYIKGTYDKKSDLFTLVNSTGTDWFTQVPNITESIKYGDYFDKDSYYMLVGYTYSTADYLSLVANNTIYYFDGTNLTPVENLDTTYESKAAASGGTDLSLVTTGEKYNWNNKVKTTNLSNSGWMTAVGVTSENSSSTDLYNAANSSIRLYNNYGTASSQGSAIIQVGNSKNQNTDGNARGRLRIYGSNSDCIDIYADPMTGVGVGQMWLYCRTTKDRIKSISTYTVSGTCTGTGSSNNVTVSLDLGEAAKWGNHSPTIESVKIASQSGGSRNQLSLTATITPAGTKYQAIVSGNFSGASTATTYNFQLEISNN